MRGHSLSTSNELISAKAATGIVGLDDILAGGVDAVIEPLLAEYQADQLAALGD